VAIPIAASMHPKNIRIPDFINGIRHTARIARFADL
jgi:hypothetical protein